MKYLVDFPINMQQSDYENTCFDKMIGIHAQFKGIQEKLPCNIKGNILKTQIQ